MTNKTEVSKKDETWGMCLNGLEWTKTSVTGNGKTKGMERLSAM